jgi:hypothetical protein
LLGDRMGEMVRMSLPHGSAVDLSFQEYFFRKNRSI